MKTLPAIAKYTAFGLIALIALFGGAFLIGETLMDPGGAPAVALAVSWTVVTLALTVYAIWRPDPATRLLAVLAILVAVFIVVDLVFHVVPRDEIGPVGAASALAVAIGLGFLGLRRPAPAGRLLLLVGVASVGAGGSGVALAVLVFAVSGLYLLATWADTQRPDHRHPPGIRAAR
jgi:hypothetical protein